MNPDLHPEYEKEIERAFHLSLRLLGYRARSVMEISRYLTQKKIPDAVIDQVIEKLKSYNYLNDTDFAKMFIENRKKFNPKSLFALGYELSQKGIHDKIIQKTLQLETDEELAWRSLFLKRTQWQYLATDAFKKKALNFLKTRGFGYEASLSALKKLKDIHDEN